MLMISYVAKLMSCTKPARGSYGNVVQRILPFSSNSMMVRPDLTERGQVRVKEGEINIRPQTGPKQVDTKIAGFKSCWWYNSIWEDLIKGLGFRPEHFITGDFERYQNYQNEFLMQSMSLGIITLILKEVKNWK
ncbi:hypothetical protein ACS0TY_003794 [Phlomoides rotata]